MQVLPLFPLPTLAYPGGVLPLQIFEPRYLRMVKQCLKAGTGFVLVQTVEQDSGKAVQPFFKIGCYCEIEDWHPLPNDLLGIDVRALRKVRIDSHQAEQDNLLIGQCEFLPAEAPMLMPEQHQVLLNLLQDIHKHPMIEMMGLDIDYQDATDVGYRLAEFLPFTAEEKQLLLESDCALSRLDAIQSLLHQLAG